MTVFFFCMWHTEINENGSEQRASGRTGDKQCISIMHSTVAVMVGGRLLDSGRWTLPDCWIDRSSKDYKQTAVL